MDCICISVAMSLDAKIDDSSRERLVISSAEDFAEVHEIRSAHDAILVGAETVRRDNPSLVFKEPRLIELRKTRGQQPELLKVTVSASGELDPACKFFATGAGRKIVIAPRRTLKTVTEKLGHAAEVLGVDSVNPQSICEVLEKEGIRKLFVEGGSSILTMFLSSGYFDRLRLAIGPFFVGPATAPPFVNAKRFWNNKERPLVLERVRMVGDTVVIEAKNVSRG